MDSILLYKIRQDKQDYQDIIFDFITFRKKLMKPNPPLAEGRTSSLYLFLYFFRHQKILAPFANNILSRRRRLGILYFIWK
jgi:hypothetical protein